MFKELFTEAVKKTQAAIDVDWASEMKNLDKELSKEYGISIKDNGRMEAKIVGDKKKILKFLRSADYDMDQEDIEDLFPELFTEKYNIEIDGNQNPYKDADKSKLEKLKKSFTEQINDLKSKSRKAGSGSGGDKDHYSDEIKKLNLKLDQVNFLLKGKNV